MATHTCPNAYHLHRGQFAKLQRRMCSSCPSVTQPTLSAIARCLCGRFFLLREIRPVLTDDAEGRLAASTSFSNSLRLCRALPSAKALDSVVAPFGVRLLGFFAGAVAVPAEDRLVPRRAVAELSTVR